MACCMVFAAINPAARLTQVNINHSPGNGTPLDIDYLHRLGADVVPMLLTNETNRRVIYKLVSRWASLTATPFNLTDWRD